MPDVTVVKSPLARTGDCQCVREGARECKLSKVADKDPLWAEWVLLPRLRHSADESVAVGSTTAAAAAAAAAGAGVEVTNTEEAESEAVNALEMDAATAADNDNDDDGEF